MEEGPLLSRLTAGRCLIDLSLLRLPSIYYSTRNTIYPKEKASSVLIGGSQPWSLKRALHALLVQCGLISSPGHQQDLDTMHPGTRLPSWCESSHARPFLGIGHYASRSILFPGLTFLVQYYTTISCHFYCSLLTWVPWWFPSNRQRNWHLKGRMTFSRWGSQKILQRVNRLSWHTGIHIHICT